MALRWNLLAESPNETAAAGQADFDSPLRSDALAWVSCLSF